MDAHRHLSVQWVEGGRGCSRACAAAAAVPAMHQRAANAPAGRHSGTPMRSGAARGGWPAPLRSRPCRHASGSRLRRRRGPSRPSDTLARRKVRRRSARRASYCLEAMRAPGPWRRGSSRTCRPLDDAAPGRSTAPTPNWRRSCRCSTVCWMSADRAATVSTAVSSSAALSGFDAAPRAPRRRARCRRPPAALRLAEPEVGAAAAFHRPVGGGGRRHAVGIGTRKSAISPSSCAGTSAVAGGQRHVDPVHCGRPAHSRCPADAPARQARPSRPTRRVSGAICASPSATACSQRVAASAGAARKQQRHDGAGFDHRQLHAVRGQPFDDRRQVGQRAADAACVFGHQRGGPAQSRASGRPSMSGGARMVLRKAARPRRAACRETAGQRKWTSASGSQQFVGDHVALHFGGAAGDGPWRG